ncbi:aldose 1-epimerase [Aquimarina algicola]|uniref:Aldose 1-epimerase n=1 Tax=Aquimarina algicola TaxID=2589995 RepID=A0A504JEU0_9FLAO|nr:aldose 1-epimerase [Aquimarina algicola]TPN86238.1 aldose 1-epimerase [Aquimarina algicola]
MYTLIEKKIQELNYIELISSDKTSKATFCLNQGGRLSSFIFENISILADFQSLSYTNNYASCVLFPFANRIKNGKYSFNGIDYTLKCNETDKNNALHGLVYNKPFDCLHTKTTSNYASITLGYTSEGDEGFPFKFSIELTYTLSKRGISLFVRVKNLDQKPFPFTIGWHPYFKSADLNKSVLQFKSNSKYLFDKQQIISDITDVATNMPFQLNEVKLDDGYPLETNKIEFFTPEYHLTFTSTSKENFLQLYTPNQPNVIAIEPMTGATDSFNNKMGLQILPPSSIYKVEWAITIKNQITQTTTKTINTSCNF